jgi:FkbM family methyltransferase
MSPGARNGFDHSNTYFFEKALQWRGILVEAVKSEFDGIAAHRANAIAVHAAVCTKPGHIDFLMSKFAGWHGQANTYEKTRENSKQDIVKVPCITLEYLLEKAGLYHINYMTVDTEGSEVEILRAFDTNRFVVDFIQVEVLHTQKNSGKELIDMMHDKGYAFEKDLRFASDTSDYIFRRTFGADVKKFEAAKKAGISPQPA